MAGDWIKFELATMDKPEVCQIADLADIDQDAVVGKLLRVWSWFDQQTQEGNAPSVSKKLLDRSVGVTGFCEHMKFVGWMEEAEGMISLPHFERHNGKTGKNRALTAKRVASHKTKSNAANVTSALPKEEKRREENIQDQKHVAPAPAPVKPKSCKFDPLTAKPANVSEQAWADWCQHRREIHKPLTAKSCEQQARALEGHATPDQVLVTSISNGWTGIFPEKVTSNVHPFSPRRPSSEPDFDSTAWAEGLVVSP